MDKKFYVMCPVPKLLWGHKTFLSDARMDPSRPPVSDLGRVPGPLPAGRPSGVGGLGSGLCEPASGELSGVLGLFLGLGGYSWVFSWGIPIRTYPNKMLPEDLQTSTGDISSHVRALFRSSDVIEMLSRCSSLFVY